MNEGATSPRLRPAREWAAGSNTTQSRRRSIEALVLVILTVCAFRGEAAKVAAQAMTMVQAAHALAVPVLVGLLVYCRREALARALRSGSVWGALTIACALVIYALTTWPFYVGYVRKLQFVTAFAGIALAIGGWKVLWHCIPMLLLAGLAMPVGWNTYSTLIIRPETLTMDVVARLLSGLADTIAELHGADLHYIRSGVGGVVGLGDPHSGCAAPVALVCLYLFVVFSRVRSGWQHAALLVLAAPIVALGNLLRTLAHAWLTMQMDAPPTDGVPRDVAMVLSLLVTYLLAGGCALLLDRLFVDADDSAVTATG